MNIAANFCHSFVIKAPCNDVSMKLKSMQRYPDQTTFQDISCCRIVLTVST